MAQAATPSAGELLREVRQVRGLTVTEVARRTGLHRTTVHRVERGVEASGRARRLVAVYLGVPAFLLGDDASA